MTNQRLHIIAENLIDYLNDEKLGNDGDELYRVLSDEIGMTDNEIDILLGICDYCEEEYDEDDEEECDDGDYRFSLCCKELIDLTTEYEKYIFNGGEPWDKDRQPISLEEFYYNEYSEMKK